jgi:N-acetylglutamate synthase-like GNAT family acetyltransferase
MKPNWLCRIYHSLKGPHPLHPDVIGNLRPLAFRRYQPPDLEQCVELYTANEAGRFPEGMVDRYRQSLIRQSSYYLVLEKGHQIIASGGLSFYIRPDVVVLCYGLVHPKHQGEGIGTALVLTRLALLPGEFTYMVFIAAVEKSLGFYRRFGFHDFKPWKDPNGQPQPCCVLAFSPREITRCRKLLVEHGISFPEDRQKIPLRTKAHPSSPKDPMQPP